MSDLRIHKCDRCGEQFTPYDTLAAAWWQDGAGKWTEYSQPSIVFKLALQHEYSNTFPLQAGRHRGSGADDLCESCTLDTVAKLVRLFPGLMQRLGLGGGGAGD